MAGQVRLMSPEGESELIVSGSLAALEARLVELVRAAKESDPLSSVTVVVGSNLQHIYLRRLLARSLGAVANVRFHTLLDLAGELYLARRSEELKPLPDGAQVLLLEAVLKRTLSRRTDIGADAAGLPQALGGTLRELREGSVGSDRIEQIPERRRWLGELARLAAAHRRELAPFLDRTRLFEEASGASDQEASGTLASGPVLVYGIYDLNALQLDVITKIARLRPLTMFVPWQEGSEPFAFATTTIERLRRSGFEVSRVEGTAPATRSERKIFSCADRQAEVEEAVRRVLEDVAAGVPPSEIAIIHRLDQVFDEILAGVLERAGLPFYAASGRPVRRTAVGRAALNLLQLIYDEPRRGTLLELLSLPCTNLDWVEEGLRPRPAVWEARSKEFGLVKGWEEFQQVLGFQLEIAQAGDPEDRRERFEEQVGALLKVVQALAAEADRTASLTTWAEHASSFSDLLERLAPGERDGDAFGAIADRLAMFAVLDEAGVAVDGPRFREAAETAIRQAVISGGYFQRDGIFVGSVMAARLLRFRRVYLLECSERTFPPVIRQDPLLLDTERERINEASEHGYLPLKRARLDEERLLFELSCQAGTERVTFGYSRHAARSSTVRLPSSFLLEEAQALSGVFRSADAIERERPEWFLRMPSRIGFQGEGADQALRALDTSDLRFHILEQGGEAALDAVRPLWPGLGRLAALQRERRERRFGPYDGIVPLELIAKEELLGRDLSASSLSDYAVCPYRFFLSKVLRLRGHAEPEETLEIAPTERGSLVHRILERFVDRYLSGGDDDWPAFLEGGDRVLEQIMEEEETGLPKGITGLPLSWRRIREQVAKEIRVYLEEERRRAEEGWRPVATERWFQGVTLGAGEQTITAHGRIDRLDRSPQGLRVVDYKTGSAGWDKADGYRKGGTLQLPLYLHAAAQEEGVPLSDCRAEFHYVSERAGYARLPLSGAELQSDGRFEEVLGAMAEGIESGAFFYRPGRQRANCRLCDFSEVCHSEVERHSLWKDPGSGDLLASFRKIAEDRGAR